MTEQAYHDMLLTADMQVRLATAAYHDVVELFADHVGAIDCGSVEAAHVSASWIEFRDHAHLSIRGTTDLHDWVQNLSAAQSKIGELTCHQGFLRSANLIRAELVDRVPLHKPIVIGGHSAGGAIAEVLVGITSRMQWREVVTFGAPRVWSVDSAPIFRARKCQVHRFVISGDPVPALPFRRFRRLFDGAEYAHANQPLQLTADGRVLLDRGNSTLRKAIRVVAGAWLYGLASVGLVRESMPTLLSRHYLSAYRDRIFAAVGRI